MSWVQGLIRFPSMAEANCPLRLCDQGVTDRGPVYMSVRTNTQTYPGSMLRFWCPVPVEVRTDTQTYRERYRGPTGLINSHKHIVKSGTSSPVVRPVRRFQLLIPPVEDVMLTPNPRRSPLRWLPGCQILKWLKKTASNPASTCSSWIEC